MITPRYKNTRLDYRRAKELRKQGSIAERMLWNALLPLKKEMGIKFRRQHPLHPYIADFACVKARLIIELDGQSHVRDCYMMQAAKPLCVTGAGQ